MDANDEEADVRLQRIADDLLGDFDASLAQFLRKPVTSSSSGTKTKAAPRAKLRARVRAREAGRMAALLDPFQEFPQLLDVHLARWLPMLADAFLESVERSNPARASATAAAAAAAVVAAGDAAMTTTTTTASTASSLVVPLQAAVAQILYTLCKVRGEKVVVGFLPVEARHLEPLLGALEAQAAHEPHADRQSDGNGSNGSWTWQERYLVLLWLSQLLLAPFDLVTISTGRHGRVDDEEDEAEETDGRSLLPDIEGFTWPRADAAAIPSITLRALPLAVRYLAVPGKERDAACALLVRVAMRHDMHELGIRQALVQWALASLDGRESQVVPASTVTATTRPRSLAVNRPYYYIGTLSFLAGILSATAGASDMDDALASIFAAVHAVAEEDDSHHDLERAAVFAAIRSSALARKMMIKASRIVTVRYIQMLDQLQDRDDQSGLDEAAGAAIETTIGYLLGRLADNDTPVRFAASKALSIITLRLPPDMAAQISDAVLEGLERNVLHDSSTGKLDLTAVDPLEWHGLMLTLAHLLYRRSPPLEALPAIVQALRRGLAFERRSVSGSATGTNVRDAACFGIWALARRYTTSELLPLHILQTLATDLVVAACLDPAGNIRRGSSAALQELIGRHPDTICQGIALVQAVDYHAVALRTRAITNVAQRATILARDIYGVALREALLGWRGFASAGDAAARRVAAASFGQVVYLMAKAVEGRGDGTSPLAYFSQTVGSLSARIQALQARQVEERHGFLLALAAVLDIFPSLAGENATTEVCLAGLGQLHEVLEKCKALSVARRPDLLAEGASRLIVSSFPLIQAAVHIGAGAATAPLAGPALLAEANVMPATLFRETVLALDTAFVSNAHDATRSALQTYTGLVVASLCGPHAWLGRQEADVIAAASDAALILLVTLGPVSSPAVLPTRHSLIASWAGLVCHPKAAAAVSLRARASGSGTSGTGYVFAVTKAFSLQEMAASDDDHVGDNKDADVISHALLGRWASDRSIDTRIALLQALTQNPAVLLQRAAANSAYSSSAATPALGHRFRGILAAGLDDYTTDSRGDVGSHVRMHALRATQVLWAYETAAADALGMAPKPKPADAGILFFRVLRLAAEKLDRVRVAAQATLAQALGGERGSYLQSLPFSSQAYFRCLLGLWDGLSMSASKERSIAAVVTTAGAATPRDSSSPSGSSSAVKWMAALMRGYVTSADTGNEELIVASRAAMVDYVIDPAEQRASHQWCLWQALLRNLPGSRAAAITSTGKFITPPDRIVIPTLEIIAFLFNAGVFSSLYAIGSALTPNSDDLLDLCRQVNDAVDKAGGVRKVEACVKVYGAVASRDPATGGGGGHVARAKLADLLQHPWPRVRNAVVDELWGLGLSQGLDEAAEAGAALEAASAAVGVGASAKLAIPALPFDILKGVDWVAADTAALHALACRLGLVR